MFAQFPCMKYEMTYSVQRCNLVHRTSTHNPLGIHHLTEEEKTFLSLDEHLPPPR